MTSLDPKLKSNSLAGEGILEGQLVPARNSWSADGILQKFPVERLKAWALRGGVSILQQGLFAGSHFVANILLARWLSPGSYGAFALAYSFFLLLLVLYMALFYEPLLVYGPGRYQNAFVEYANELLRGHFAFLVPVCLLIFVVSPLIGRFYTREFQAAFAALAAICPFLLLVWLLRGVFYARLNPYTGAAAGAGYFVLLILSIRLLKSHNYLSPATALASMGFSSFLVSIFCILAFYAVNGKSSRQRTGLTLRILADHWRYGGWAALTAIVAWIPVNIYYVFLPARFGLEGTAKLRALMNLMYPLLHSFTALLTLLIPILVRQRERSGVRRAKQTTLQLIAMYLPVGALYFALVVIFRKPILQLLYAGRYTDVHATAVLCVAALPITAGVIGLLGAALRSFERPRLVFSGYLASAILSFVAGVPITLRYGVPGAALAMLLTDLLTIVVLSICFARFQQLAGVET